jgi:hypothetical protein
MKSGVAADGGVVSDQWRDEDSVATFRPVVWSAV